MLSFGQELYRTQYAGLKLAIWLPCHVRWLCLSLVLHIQTPEVPLPPPFTEGWKLQDGQPVTRELYATLVDMIEQMNKAVAVLPELQPVEVR